MTVLLTPNLHLMIVELWKIISIQAVQQVFYSSAGPVPLSVYQRLKKLEDRILELEGLSPEYFQSTVSPLALKQTNEKHLILITQPHHAQVNQHIERIYFTQFEQI